MPKTDFNLPMENKNLICNLKAEVQLVCGVLLSMLASFLLFFPEVSWPLVSAL